LGDADARATLVAEQSRPERQGLLGLLSVGFIAAAAVTVLGFLIYSVVAFRRRSIELGALRAIGLARWQMLLYVTAEQILIIGSGAVIGTVLGVTASRLFIPFLRVADAKGASAPPLIVDIAWNGVTNIYSAFAVMLLLTLIAMAVLLSRMRLFETIKLGETV